MDRPLRRRFRAGSDLQETSLWRTTEEDRTSPPAVGRHITDLVTNAPGDPALDAVEMMWAGLVTDRRDAFAVNVNTILETEESCWHMVNSACIRPDPEFIGAGAAETMLHALTSGPFAGAADEYAKAMREQVSGEVKDAVSDAAKSFESTLKVLTGIV